ncbi:uncharacterized protein LOC118513536 isoform X2 [Anopheles stephensi]|uniref:uncharacterized protein LOC118513536 isoform X2 n=1 Tax=Anopheles stephensi TaxID=30069 RepID=UPI0016587196|nr:uncharacterized protein LOC118513536 isoform X2 [Anopheles stephensi]
MGTYWSGRSVTLWLLLVATVVRIDSLPITSLLDDDSDYDDSFENDYDLVFDQRQNGTANVRVSVDGVMVALPAPDMSPSATLAGATLLDLFASQLSAAGEGGEDDSSEETYGTISGSASSSAASATGASSTTSTTVAPTTSTTTATVVASDPLLASDFPYQGLSANLPASLLGQGLSFFFNPKRGEIPFRLNTAPESTNPAIPILITKLDKAPAARDPEANGSNEDSREIAASQETPKQQHAGKKKRTRCALPTC